MRVAPTRDKLYFNDLQHIYICIHAYMPHIHMLQLIEILRPVTNGPLLDIPAILNKYLARSAWTIFTFPRLNAIFENG